MIKLEFQPATGRLIDPHAHFAVTLANSGEFSLDMIGELLTHKSVAMTKRYSQFLPGTVKKASERAAELIQKQINKKPENRTIEISGR